MNHVIWTEKYRPHTIQECILPVDLKTTFQEIVNSGVVQNMILSGKAGAGKTTIARAMCEELDISHTVINASLKGNIDTLRTDILEFVTTMSFEGGRKVVILDEADHLNPVSTQPALRNFIEEYAINASFIFTCNYPNKIIPELHSRASIVDFKIPKDEKVELQKQYHKRLRLILDTEGVPYDPAVLAQVVVKYWPDMRRTINELQKYATRGRIDDGILAEIKDAPMADVLKALKEGNFKAMREWCALHNEGDSVRIMRKVYDCLYEVFKKDCVPDVVMMIGNYQYQAAFVQDHEIHLAAFLTELGQVAKFL
jgi:DNA polymerase III delta prime subunit